MEIPTSSLDVAVQDSSPPVVRVAGQADFHNRHQLHDILERLIDDGHTRVSVDLSNLDYIDTSAISTLVTCAMKMAEAGGKIGLAGVSSQVSRAMTLCGVAAFFASVPGDVPTWHENGHRAPSENFWHVSDFAVPASPDSAVLARGRVACMLRSLPIGLPESEDVMLAVGEAIANAIKHGCGCDPSLRISVRCVAGPGRLTIEVIDPGPGFDPEKVAAGSRRSLAEGGMGIYMMRLLMDEVSFAFEGSTMTRLVKYLPKPAGERAPSDEVTRELAEAPLGRG